MFSKCIFIFVLIQVVPRFIYGQQESEFFRRDYIYMQDLKNFYKISTLAESWEEAKNKCEMEGATLFYPEDRDEADIVTNYWNLTQPFMTTVFIGVSNRIVKDVFETVDGREISQVYDTWGYGEPNNDGGSEGCVTMRVDGTLRDENCHKSYPYICKKTLSSVLWNAECNIPDLSYKYNAGLQRCYKFHLTPKNWTEAYRICRAEQSYLAILNSQEENQYLIKLTAEAPKDNIQGNYLRGAVHLGFEKKDGLWVTNKGVPLHMSGFDGWGYTQPDGGDREDCGSMFYTGQLNDIGCFHRMFFICEHEIEIKTEDINYKYGNTDRDIRNQNKLPYHYNSINEVKYI